MSKKRTKKQDTGNVLTMDPAADSPDSPPILEEIQPDTAAAPAAPPPPAQKPPKKSEGFFDRLRDIAVADWGTRYYLYVYRLEPLIDRLRSGEIKYVMRYSEPIEEQKIMLEHGSGRYRINLVALKPATGKNSGTEIGRYECDILNASFPPKIPKGEWMDDPRNKKWAWAKEPDAPPAPAVVAANANSTILDAMRTVSEIRNQAREEFEPEETPDNPISAALGMAKDLLQMRADNPMVDILREELKDIRAEAMAERAENRKLQAEMRAPTATAAESNPISNVVKTIKELEPLFEKFMPKITEAGKEIVRGRRPGFGELLMEQGLPILGDILKPWSNVLAARFMQNPANGYAPAANIAPQPLAPPPGQPALAPPLAPQASPPRLLQFLAQPLVMGALQSHFVQFQKEPQGEAGLDFAYWIFTSGAGEQPLIDARALGTTQILAMFKASPAWPQMQPYEAKLTQFLDQVLSWRKEQEQTGEPVPPDDDDEETDLTATM